MGGVGSSSSSLHRRASLKDLQEALRTSSTSSVTGKENKATSKMILGNTSSSSTSSSKKTRAPLTASGGTNSKISGTTTIGSTTESKTTPTGSKMSVNNAASKS
ncbi:unnamed protein product, partial [Amoebophrya sp. A25]|eukprot:GSA25T00020602001.1